MEMAAYLFTCEWCGEQGEAKRPTKRFHSLKEDNRTCQRKNSLEVAKARALRETPKVYLVRALIDGRPIAGNLARSCAYYSTDAFFAKHIKKTYSEIDEVDILSADVVHEGHDHLEWAKEANVQLGARYLTACVRGVWVEIPDSARLVNAVH